MLAIIAVFAMFGAAVASTAEDALRPGDFVWSPELAPRGPLVVLVDLVAQRAYVYRNGVRIGISTVSTGRTGFDTQPGIYTVLEKQRKHYSNLYDNAPMPYMQRLTWTGLALHAGVVPGHPASHGCVRLPPKFAERLFDATTPGTTVVVQGEEREPAIAPPGFLAPVDVMGRPSSLVDQPNQPSLNPALSPFGPLTVVLDVRSRRMVVLRNAVPIGETAITLKGRPPSGTSAYVLLDGALDEPSPYVPDRPRRRWMMVATDSRGAGDQLAGTLHADALVIPPEFARQVYDLLSPGATVVVTDEPTGALDPDTPLLRVDTLPP